MSQVALYLLVGLLATATDFAAYNLLSNPPFRWRRIPAHCLSTVVAMVVGFTLHSVIVFRPQEALVAERLVRYVAIVLASAYIVQTFIIYSLTYLWATPARLVSRAGRALWEGLFPNDIIERNFVKMCSVASRMGFNYFSFKFFVYAD